MLSKQWVGCVVNGLNYECASEVDNASCAVVNRISLMELNELVIQQRNHDFPENQYDEREEIGGHYQFELSFKQSDPEIPNNCQLEEQIAKFLKRNFKSNKCFVKNTVHSWKM